MNEPNYFVAFQYFWLILQPLQTVTNRSLRQFFKALPQTIIRLHIFKTCLASHENWSVTGLIRLEVSNVSFK